MRGPTAPRDRTSLLVTAFAVMAFAAFGALALFHSAPSGAVPTCSISWAAPVGGDWSSPANWAPQGTPQPGDDVCITTPGTYTVTMEGAQTIDSLTLGSGNTGNSEQLQLTDLGCGGDAALTTGSTTVADTINSTGLLDLTSSCGSHGATFATNSSLANSGGIGVDAGAGGARGLAGGMTNSGIVAINAATSYSPGATWDNQGPVNLADGASLTVGAPAGTPGIFYDDTGGSVVSSGSAQAGTLVVSQGNTYEQGAGITSGGPVVVGTAGGTQVASVAYVGNGASTISAQGPGLLTGSTMASGQSLTILAGCAGPATETLGNNVASAGQIFLSSAGCSGDVTLVVPPADTLTLSGPTARLETDPGSGGARVIDGNITTSSSATTAITVPTQISAAGTFDNGAVLNISDNTKLLVNAGVGGTFVNDAGGSVVTSGSGVTGVLFVQSGNTLRQDAGTSSGGPIVVENGALSFTGSGGTATINVRGTAGTLTGNIGSGDVVNVQAVGCLEDSTATASTSLTNAGTIDLTSTACAGGSSQLVLSAGTGGLSTLVNTGTIRSDPGAGGTRGITGNVVNGTTAPGTVVIATPTTYTPSEASGANTLATTFDNKGTVSLTSVLLVSPLASATAIFTDDAGGSVSSTGAGQLRVVGPGIYTQGSGTTTGNAVIVVNGTTTFLAGGGTATVWAEGTSGVLKGTVNAGQTYQVEAVGAGGSAAMSTLSGKVTVNGVMDLNSMGSFGGQDTLKAPAGATLAIGATGVLQSDAGTGGSRALSGAITVSAGGSVNVNVGTSWTGGVFTNGGTVNIADSLSFLVTSTTGTVFTNGATGKIVTTGASTTGSLFVFGDTFNEGGITSGGPVYVQGGKLVYTGAGSSSINAWGAVTLSGNIAKGQTLTVQAIGCVTDSSIADAGNLTVNGSLVLTATNCHGGAASLSLGAAPNNILTIGATGNVSWPAGAGGTRTMIGNILNKGLAGGSTGSTLSLTGTYKQTTNAVYAVSVMSPTTSDRIVATGTVALAGKLVAAPVSGFTPAHGTTWANVISGSGRTGKFTTVSGPGGTWTSAVTSKSASLAFP